MALVVPEIVLISERPQSFVGLGPYSATSGCGSSVYTETTVLTALGADVPASPAPSAMASVVWDDIEIPLDPVYEVDRTRCAASF